MVMVVMMVVMVVVVVETWGWCVTVCDTVCLGGLCGRLGW
jgi:hypothetical protein